MHSCRDTSIRTQHVSLEGAAWRDVLATRSHIGIALSELGLRAMVFFYF